MSGDIVAFARARLDEVEARVRNDIAPWFGDDCVIFAQGSGSDLLVPGADAFIRPLIDPHAVLRGVEAKRRVVDMHVELDYHEDGTPVLCGGYSEAYWEALCALASEWSTHPDYRSDWTP